MVAAKKEKTEPARKEKIQEVIEALNKEHGKGVVVTNEAIPGIEWTDSGCYSLNKILGNGWAKGRIVEIFGPESSSKTTLCLEAMAQVQKAGGTVLFVDAEHAMDPVYAQALGVDTDSLIFSQPSFGEQALDVVEAFCSAGAVDLAVIDSVAALIPRAEIEGGMGKEQMGLHPRLMSKAMRIITGPAAKSGATIMFTNQFRQKMVMYGNPNITTGGNALKFYASQRLELRRLPGDKGLIKVDGEPVAIEVNAKVIKNKVAPPFKETSLRIVYGRGIDRELDLLRVAIDRNIIEKSATWFTYKDIKAQGEDKICQILRDKPELFSEIIQKLKG